MARLISLTAVALACLAPAWGCSILYDADDLHATRRVDGDAAPLDGAEVAEEVADLDLQAPDDSPLTEIEVSPDVPLADVSPDVPLAEVSPDVPVSDAVDAVEEDAVDTVPSDTLPVDDDAPLPDGVAPSDSSDSTDPHDPSDAGPEPPVLRLVHSGMNGCVLDYYLQFLTGCPKTCGWQIALDATESTGVQSFTWRFSATNGYTVSPETASGPSPTVNVGFPSCTLLGGNDVGPARVLIEVRLNGGPFEIVSTVDFGVRMVSSCPSSGQGACPLP